MCIRRRPIWKVRRRARGVFLVAPFFVRVDHVLTYCDMCAYVCLRNFFPGFRTLATTDRPTNYRIYCAQELYKKSATQIFHNCSSAFSFWLREGMPPVTPTTVLTCVKGSPEEPTDATACEAILLYIQIHTHNKNRCPTKLRRAFVLIIYQITRRTYAHNERLCAIILWLTTIQRAF